MYNSVYIPGDTHGFQRRNAQQQQRQLGSTARVVSPHTLTPAATSRLHSNAIQHASATTVLDSWQLRTFEDLGVLCWFCRWRLRSAAWLGGGRAGAGNCRAPAASLCCCRFSMLDLGLFFCSHCWRWLKPQNGYQQL